jgi:4-hydroxybenzoate polyprenyltransferase/geranylgeranylglycerol-phosphate geranylgeranyltransferase
MCGWLAGHYVGDYFDRDIDARSKPGRPVPSGRVSPREALAAGLALIAAGNLAALRLGPKHALVAILTTSLGIAYSKVFKGQALLGNLDRGVLGACAVAFGALTSAGRLSAPALLLSAATIGHDGATNLVGAVRDVDGDRASGCRTVPVVYGRSPAVRIAVGLAGLSWSLALATLAVVRPSRVAVALFGAATLLDLLVYPRLVALGAKVRRPQALTAHKLLVVERLVLSAAFIAARAPRLALLLTATTVPISAVLQARMRDRHEQQAPSLDEALRHLSGVATRGELRHPQVT